jgi:hypothetical protein
VERASVLFWLRSSSARNPVGSADWPVTEQKPARNSKIMTLTRQSDLFRRRACGKL